MTGIPADAEDTELLNQVRDAVAVLLTELPRSPERLRIRAGDVAVELEWPAPGTSAPEHTAAADRTPAELRVTAPNVGTFHRGAAVGGDPFVHVGDRVAAGQQVGVVEVLRLMLPVEAAADGVITDVLVEEGQPVEYGQALFTLQKRT